MQTKIACFGQPMFESSQIIHPKEKIKIQPVEPYNHHVNATKPAVKTAKYHIVTGLGTVNVNCPLQLWCKFLPQTQDLINMMRTLRRNPKISAFEELNGTFDYTKTPISILGSRTLAYNTYEARATWKRHGKNGFYVGPCYFHYRLMEHFIPATRSYRK